MGQDRTVHPLIALAILLAADALTPAPTPLAKALELDCPRGTNGEIVVCRSKSGERYRIPDDLRPNGFDIHGTIDSVSRERNRLFDEGSIGETICTNVGTNGHAGCQIQQFRDWSEQKAHN